MKPAVRSSWNLNFTERFYACSSCKQVWRRSDWNEHHFFPSHECMQLQNDWPDLAVIRTCPRFYGIHHFLQYKSMGKNIQCSRANNSKLNNLIRPKCELIPSFYANLTNILSKVTEKSYIQTSFFFHRSRAFNSKVPGVWSDPAGI